MAVNVRYIVRDVESALVFYTQQLGFQLEMHPAPGFALLSHGELRLMLNAPGAGGAGQSMSDQQVPQPGGWNRFQLVVDDLDATHAELKKKGVRFRSEIIQGNGGRQLLVMDPSDNLVELFEPKAQRA
jgi:predicted enzyme related to lactoylglutathione lyase